MPLACIEILMFVKSRKISGIYRNAMETIMHTLYGTFIAYRPAASSLGVTH